MSAVQWPLSAYMQTRAIELKTSVSPSGKNLENRRITV